MNFSSLIFDVVVFFKGGYTGFFRGDVPLEFEYLARWR